MSDNEKNGVLGKAHAWKLSMPTSDIFRNMLVEFWADTLRYMEVCNRDTAGGSALSNWQLADFVAKYTTLYISLKPSITKSDPALAEELNMLSDTENRKELFSRLKKGFSLITEYMNTVGILGVNLHIDSSNVEVENKSVGL